MSSVSDLTVNVKCDVSELTEGMTESRRELALTTTTIEVQDATWRGLAQSAVQSAAEIAPAIARITEAAAGLAGTVIAYRAWGPAIAATAAPVAGLGTAFLRFGGIAASIVGYLVPQWKAVTLAISSSLLVYKVVTSDMAAASYKAVVGSASVSASVDKLSTAFGKLGEAAAAPFGKIEAGAESLLQSINPLPYILGTIEKTTAGWIDSATAGIEYLTPLVVEFGDVAETAVFITSSWGQATAEQTQNFYEQGKALRELAAETERLMALQEAQRPLFANLGAIQDAATDAAKQAAEIRRLGSIETIEALNAEMLALQQKAAQEILAGEATEESQKRLAALFAAIANQRENILAGGIKPKEDEASKAIEAAATQLATLVFGQDAVTRATLRMKGATAEQIAELERFQTQIANVKAEQEAAKEAEREFHEATKKAAADAQKALDDAWATWQKGEDRIRALQDQLDLASGAATKAEIAMREAFAAGYTEEQAREIADLTDQLDQLEQGKKKKEVKDIGKTAVNELGSSDALSSIFASIRGSDTDKQLRLAEEQLRQQEEMVAFLERIADEDLEVVEIA